MLGKVFTRCVSLYYSMLINCNFRESFTYMKQYHNRQKLLRAHANVRVADGYCTNVCV